MKKLFKILELSFFAVWMITFSGCKKDFEIPTLTTTAASDITSFSSVAGGNVTSSGGAEVTARGVCWSTLHNPTIFYSKTKDGTGFGTFSSNIAGLMTNTTYYVRAYATNSVGTAYGNEISFTSSSILFATLTTAEATSIELSGAVSGGNIISDGGVPVTARGICWSTSRNPTVADNKTTNGTGTGSFTSDITGLLANTTYYIRAYATNSVGTSYGNEIPITLYPLPNEALTTIAVTGITDVSAVSGGTIANDGGENINAKGVCWSTSGNPTITDSKTIDGTGTGIFTSNLTGLKPGTTYFVRAYATNSGGIFYGIQLIFTTSPEKVAGIQKTDFPGGARYGGAGFSIGNKIYMGLGYNDGKIVVRDFWEWDQASNTWTKKADYPTNLTGGAVGFSIGSKGYIGFGNDLIDGVTNEFWEYDPSTDSWTKKTSIPGNVTRANTVGFSIGTKGYIGTGYSNDGFSSSYLRDFWEWDQATNAWTKKADFPGNARTAAVGFSIGSKGYIGTGGDGNSLFKDFWEWDQETNIWTRKADFPGMSRFSAVSFSIGDKVFLGTGISNGILLNDFWEWDQPTNVWTQKISFAGNVRAGAVGLSIGNKAYIGTGVRDNDFHALKDFWEYDPNLK